MAGLNWEKANRQQKVFDDKLRSNMLPHHKCPSCNSPIYDKKPVCGVCFKNGKYPRRLWRKK
jgi:uncharacterized OB-fold protein